MLPRGRKKCNSLGVIKRLFCRKSAILSIRWKLQFRDGWGGSLKKCSFWCNGPSIKAPQIPLGHQKTINAIWRYFLEFGDTKKCHTFSGLELVPKSSKKLIGGLSCMHKGQKCIQTLWDRPKKIPFVEKYKECAICAILRGKPILEHTQRLKKVLRVLRCAQNALQRPQKMQFPRSCQEKNVYSVESLRFCR